MTQPTPEQMAAAITNARYREEQARIACPPLWYRRGLEHLAQIAAIQTQRAAASVPKPPAPLWRRVWGYIAP